ncbi:thermonuclease family protein [Kordiimonas sp.]|uniref:thermonuclease family protein n=1 Tax=Kordiimonas sp. TaxID=1970157 RepID=UPI003A94AA56
MVALLGIGSAAAQESAATLVGIASVQDGDGLLFGQVEVRLQGIAAPEMRQPMGRESYFGLVQLIEGKEVRCELDGTVANRRPVGVCFIAGRDIGRVQVAAGLARDCAGYSKGRYRDDEIQARTEGKDLSQVYDLPGYC